MKSKKNTLTESREFSKLQDNFMNYRNAPIAIIIIASIVAWAVYTFGNWNQEPTQIETQPEVSETQQESDEEEIERNDNLTYTGWIPAWAAVPGYNAVVQGKNLFNDISPVWFEIEESGKLVDKRPNNAKELVELARQNEIELIPSIAMFDHELFTKVLQNEDNLSRHIDEIHQTVVKNDYDGIDLDYESTKLSDKDKYFEFLQRLSEKMRASDKKISVAVLAKWGDDVDYPYLPQTRQVQDWSEIAKYADEIRIMTYDYTSASARNPGPIAPLDWMQEVIDYARSKADPSKFVLGVHLYSYERWLEVPNRNNNPGFDAPSLQFKKYFFENTERGDSPARSYSYDVVQKVLDKYEGQVEGYQGEKIYRYSKVNDQTGVFENRVLVYIDPQGVQDRAELAKKNGLKGLAFWQLGGGVELLEELE